MLIQSLKKKLAKWNEQTLIRKRSVIAERKSHSNIISMGDKAYINFASNDYLALIKHPKITAAFIKGVDQYGFGSGASALVTGYFESHREFEEQFAKWLKVDRTILFNSGYLANIGVLKTMAKRTDTILSDKLCHASILDGIHLSRAKHIRYNHGSIEHLQQLSKENKPNLIITESVFSMEGDIAPIQKIIQVAEEQQAALIIDDAHGIGILGSKGRGVTEQYNMEQNQYSCLIMPLGKSFNGIGAIVAGRNDVIEAILQFSASYRYTTSLPPSICNALLAALDLVIKEQWRRDQLQANIQFFIYQAKERELSLSSLDETPIKSIIVGDNVKVMQMQDFLLSKGFYISAIRAPAVPSARLRISLNCLHTRKQITNLLDHIYKNI